MDEFIHAPRILRRKVLGNIEIPDFAGNPGRERGSIEACNRTDPRTTREDVLPGLFDGIAHRRNDAKAGNDDSATYQIILRENMKEMREKDKVSPKNKTPADGLASTDVFAGNHFLWLTT
jgi:hypothetical protein